jgi:hypothetical protein
MKHQMQKRNIEVRITICFKSFTKLFRKSISSAFFRLVFDDRIFNVPRWVVKIYRDGWSSLHIIIAKGPLA